MGIQQYMKLKQPYYQRKRFVLPHIKNFEPNRFTTLKISNNRSLPKIPSSFPQPIEQNSDKQLNPDKQRIRQKLKAIYKKKNNILLNNVQTESNSNIVHQPNMRNQFQKEIQKNLMIIKREKENKQFNSNAKKRRYNSPPPIAVSSDEFTTNNKKQPRCITEQDVFSKINNIIMNSQSRSALLTEEGRKAQFSSMRKRENHKHPAQIKKSKRRIITDLNLASDIRLNQINQKPIKHEGNYIQWRKVSIDSPQNGLIKYDISSYEMQTDRLEKIRSKNDLSLKKYFQGKTYLNRLINYRDSSSIISKKK